jgi:hypothetical protein
MFWERFAIAVLGLGSLQVSLGQNTSFTQVHVFGAASLTTGQTMRLSVVNPGFLLPTTPAFTCNVELDFVNESGSTVKRVSTTVAPFNSTTADLNRDSEIAGDSSVMIHAVVRNLQVIMAPANTVPTEAQFCPLVPTVEIIDNATQRTKTVLSNAKVYTTIPGIASAGR